MLEAWMIGINVGSGQRPFGESWINVDSVWHEGMPKPDVICDGAHLPFESGYADYVCLHHVLEHFGCGGGRIFLREAHRVLTPGGSLLVFVPDLRKLVKLWFSVEISTQIYMTNLYGAYMGHDEDRHKWGYDLNSLVEFIDHCPHEPRWNTIKQFDWTPIPGADIARDDRWILGVEAIK